MTTKGVNYDPRQVSTMSRDTTMVEVMGRYSNIPQPLLSEQTARALRAAIRSEPVRAPAPRVHALDRRLSPDVVRQLLGDYQAGVSANQLATRYQLSRSSVRRLLRASGVPRRYQAMTEAEVDQAVELYQSVLTIAEVAAKLDRPWSTVQTALTRRGVVRRSRHDYC
jgi:AraC-like DNA-binding protein